MARHIISTRIVPFLIFPLITALGCKYIICHILESKLASKIQSHCGIPLESYSDQLSSTNFVWPYTGIASFDRSFGCGSVVFFHAVIDSPDALPIIKYYLATVIPLLLTQIASFGATFPMFCLALVISGGVERARHFNARSFSGVQAESIAFAMIIGVVVPSLAMFIFDHPTVTWFWQLYPIYISIFQNLYLRSPSRSTPSGYSTIRLLYITTFLVSACTHLNLVWKHKDNLSTVVQFLFPSTQIPDPAVNIDLQTLHILNWDFTLGNIAGCTALLWYAENLRQIVIVLAWYALATPLLGLGTAFMGVAMWRDGILW